MGRIERWERVRQSGRNEWACHSKKKPTVGSHIGWCVYCLVMISWPAPTFQRCPSPRHVPVPSAALHPSPGFWFGLSRPTKPSTSFGVSEFLRMVEHWLVHWLATASHYMHSGCPNSHRNWRGNRRSNPYQNGLQLTPPFLLYGFNVNTSEHDHIAGRLQRAYSSLVDVSLRPRGGGCLLAAPAIVRLQCRSGVLLQKARRSHVSCFCVLVQLI